MPHRAAVLTGLSRAARPHFQLVWLVAPAVAIAAWMLDSRGKRVAAVLAVTDEPGGDLVASWYDLRVFTDTLAAHSRLVRPVTVLDAEPAT